MNYQETLDFLYSALPMFQRIGAAAYRKDLTNTIALCDFLDNPQRQFRSIHVAGTNGKGSTSHMLAAILQCAGYKTGLHTSPHLKEFTERIKVNGHEVDQQYVIDFVERVRPAIQSIQPSFFELSVAMAFDYFALKAVDLAVIEVGMGGRLDSTNVIHPMLSVITNISFDHKEFLGDTLPQIAGEKAGIIKSGVPVVISEHLDEVDEVFRHKAGEENAEITFAGDEIEVHPGGNEWEVLLHGRPWLYPLHPGLKGDYQKKNIPGVLAAVLKLRSMGLHIADSAIMEGVKNVVPLTGLKGRWQTLREKPLTICDTGHNPAGIGEVVEQIRKTPYRHLHFVMGAVREKDLGEIFKLLPKDAAYYFCQARIPRAMDANELYRLAAEAGLKGQVIRDVNDALNAAIKAAGNDDLVFVGGSTFVVAELNDL